ncbi:hypothetical protein GGS23DRAFT_556276 [Durotheca rogersii]|uniref:uncharacterized protein n=1 Tax=Durotheca rogersii TaxID=419775 RepID=UPI00221E5442|nr:uncharacterized protein GGS23DRAFT_556276 [Durotheca rogersii]KAI5866262.1 hypothetical protein GGS23DRAFT_556276 [Durotheca rogersii]
MPVASIILRLHENHRQPASQKPACLLACLQRCLSFNPPALLLVREPFPYVLSQLLKSVCAPRPAWEIGRTRERERARVSLPSESSVLPREVGFPTPPSQSVDKRHFVEQRRSSCANCTTAYRPPRHLLQEAGVRRSAAYGGLAGGGSGLLRESLFNIILITYMQILRVTMQKSLESSRLEARSR